MKFFVLTVLVAVAAAGTLAKPIVIPRSLSDLQENGIFYWNFSNEDGIAVSAAGVQNRIVPRAEDVGIVSGGSYSYISPEGLAITVNWVK